MSDWNEGERVNVARAQDYLADLERFCTGAELARHFDPEAVVEIMPNKISPQGSKKTLSELLPDAEKGRKLLSAQRYAIGRVLAAGEQVVVQLEWSGTLAVALGPLPVGKELKAHVAVFLELKDGRILRQRNYDCYEAW